MEFNNDTNQNMALYISNKGDILSIYSKHHLIPIVEKDYTKGVGDVKILDTDIGKLAFVICYDNDFPNFINSISRNHIDLLIDLSWDYPGIAEFHSNEARYRAIEGGFNLVKNTAHGITMSSSYKGVIISTYTSKECEDYFVVSNINNHGVRTVYSYIGIFCNYFYLLVIIILILHEKFSKNGSGLKKEKVINLKTEKLIDLRESGAESNK